MSNDLLITLIFAGIAAFVIFKLRSVLGRRTGHESPHDMFGRRESGESRNGSANGAADGANDNVVSLPGAREPERDRFDPVPTEAQAGVRDVQRADPTFDPDGFLDGARQAFRMIVEAFAAGDRETLKPLLEPDVYEDFAAAITEREKAGETQETSIERFRGVELADARMEGREAQVSVLFVTEQIKATRDRDGKLLEGDPEATETISDLWTFTRDTRSDNPNWQLGETAVPD